MENLKKQLERANLEFKRKNRWLVNFYDIDIDPWLTSTTSRPKFTDNRNWLGFNKGYSIDIMEISLRDVIGSAINKELHDNILKNKVNLDFTIEMLDPKGDVTEKWLVTGCEVLELDFGELCYGDDSIMEVKILVKPKQVKLLF